MKMEEKTVRKSLLSFCLCIVLCLGLIGCGGAPSREELEANMKEFDTPDQSVTILMDKSWKTVDAGSDNWIIGSNSSGSEALIMMQFPKSVYGDDVSSLDDVEKLIGDGYVLSDEKELEKPAFPGALDQRAKKCKVEDKAAGVKNLAGYLLCAETDSAYYMIFSLASKDSAKQELSFRITCETLKENVTEEENTSEVAVTDTILWMNGTCAVLTELNGWDYKLFGGLPVNESNAAMEKELLEEWWGVTDRASADETLDWLLTEGHRTDYISLMTNFEADGMSDVPEDLYVDYLLEFYDVTEEQAYAFANAYAAYQKSGASAIDGWDYCRAVSLLGYYYLAGYYTETEALDKAFEVSQKIQSEFGSWDEMMESYLIGYEYWGETSSEERRDVYEEIKYEEGSPYLLDWNLPLEKTW